MEDFEVSILLITTGGTIDKAYGTGSGIRDLHIGNPVAPAILQRMGYRQFEHLELCRKDSLDMTEDDREVIARACAQVKTTKIIITHGTDTMLQTARTIGDVLERHYTVVITGAAQPACMRNSDAEFNLGLALATCLSAMSGIYIAMNGVRPSHLCQKNPQTGVFEYLKSAA